MLIENAFYLSNEPVIVQNSFLPPPVLTFNPQIEKWRLEYSYTYSGNGFNLTVPAGYEFDLASVPRAIWWAIAPFQLSIVAPLIHDFLYDYGGKLPTAAIQPYKIFTRREADDLFLSIMRTEGIPELRCRIAYNAVRAFGSFPWKGNTLQSEERALQLLPV